MIGNELIIILQKYIKNGSFDQKMLLKYSKVYVYYFISTPAFELMQDAGLPKPKARPEDIVNNDLKSTLRVLYNLFTKYKHLN